MVQCLERTLKLSLDKADTRPGMNLLELQVLIVVSGVAESAAGASLLEWVAQSPAGARPLPDLRRIVSSLPPAQNPSRSRPS